MQIAAWCNEDDDTDDDPQVLFDYVHIISSCANKIKIGLSELQGLLSQYMEKNFFFFHLLDSL